MRPLQAQHKKPRAAGAAVSVEPREQKSPWKHLNRQPCLLDTPGMVQQEPGDPRHIQSHTSG